jgi:hypothetical protein
MQQIDNPLNFNFQPPATLIFFFLGGGILTKMVFIKAAHRLKMISI